MYLHFLLSCFFFFNDTATTEIYTFPYTTLFRSHLHAYSWRLCRLQCGRPVHRRADHVPGNVLRRHDPPRAHPHAERCREHRSEEHTSELQSPCNLVCRLLLEKKHAAAFPELNAC